MAMNMNIQGQTTAVHVDYFSDSTPEKTNYNRVVCIILEKGNECLQAIMLDHLPEGCDTLEDAIFTNREKLMKLKDKKVLTQQQILALGVDNEGQDIDTAAFDMSLWYTLIRNISLLHNKVNWKRIENQGIHSGGVMIGHDIIRLRAYRNYLVHLPYPKLDDKQFDQIWKALSAVFLRRGIKQEDIDAYLLDQIDPVKAMNMFFSLQKQVHSDLEGYFQEELKKKRIFAVGLFIVVAALVAAAGFICWVVYTYSQTWTSCIDAMDFRISPNSAAVSFMPRGGWKAEPPRRKNKALKLPLDYVIIGQTQATGRCLTTDDCCDTMRRVQKLAFDKSKETDDTPFNYFVGEDGVVYEGRGNVVSAAAYGWNRQAITIAFLGTFITYKPDDDSIFAARSFLQYLVDDGVLSTNFTIYGLCQVRPIPFSPGCPFYKNIKTWKATAPNNTWSWRPGSYCEKCHCFNCTTEKV